MKKLITVAFLAPMALVFAGQYQGDGWSSCPSCRGGRGAYLPQQNYQNYQGYQEQSYAPGYSYSQQERGYPQPSYNASGYQQQYQNQQGYSYQNQQGYPSNNLGDGYQGQAYQNQNRGFNNYSNQQQPAFQDQNRNYNSQSNYAAEGQKKDLDQEVSKKIRDTIGSGWFSKGYQDVTFDVRNGIVSLRGSVDTLEDKNKVEDSVRKIDGVKQVNSQISVNPTVNPPSTSYNPSAYNQKANNNYPQDSASSEQDKQLNSRIRDRLSANLPPRAVEFLVLRTANGVVVIGGTVERQEDAQKINEHVKNVDGVKSVNSQVTVRNR